MSARVPHTAVLVGLVLAGAIVTAALAQPEAAQPQMLEDAELAAVTFVDADRGWAVGDRGVIWHTSDGGRTWKLQNSGVTCRLASVQFLDAENGFVVGGWTQPYTHSTHGVALRTRDGGRTWQNTPDLTLPALTHVRFFDARNGWAIGDGSPLYPTGVFRSQDGGRTWAPVPKGQSAGWVAGDFRDATSGALAGLGGQLATVNTGEVRASHAPALGARYLQKMLLTGPTGGWLVGDGGLVLVTNDGGLSWQEPASPIPEVAARQMDFRTVAAIGNRVWLAGAPGTLVVHSPDGGQTWQLLPTGHHAPLRGLTFIDEYRGWAVGALGAILHTRDGGRSWRVQRSGGQRAALLCVFGEPGRVPLEIVADQCGNGGFLTAVEILGRREPTPGAEGTSAWTTPRRTHAAVVAAGGSGADTAWRFPLPEMDLMPTSTAILAKWNAANDAQAAQRLEEHLVKRIRQWRPEVIVTDDVSPRGDQPLAHLTNQLTLAAVNQAADASAYPEQIQTLGLSPWQVKKVLALLPPDKQGIVNVTPSQWAERLGRSIAEQAEMGRGLLACDVASPPQNIGLSLLVDRLPQGSGKRDIMSGIVIAPGGEARRQLANPPAGDLKRLADMAQKRHNVMQLLARMETSSTIGAGWLGQVRDLTDGLGGATAGDILWQLARKYQQSGKLDEAAEAMELLLQKHPQHPLADAAALWLVKYYASGEVAWRLRQDTRIEERAAAGIDYAISARGASGPQVQQAAFASTVAGTGPLAIARGQRAARALAIAKLVEQRRPTLYADPALRFALAANARQAGQPRGADRFFQALVAPGGSGVWSQNTAAEQWVSRPNGNPPKKVCSVVTVTQKPRLDGRLDDPLWKSAKAVTLQGAPPMGAEAGAVVAMTYDEEFLYLAISCPKAAGVDYAASAAARVADADLSDRDRVMVVLDIDRDYATYWSLTMDHRGWPVESCFGDATWNPEWFIAAAGDEEYWTVEAAISLAELSPAQPKPRDVWAVGVQRVIPRVGLQSFTVPAAVDVVPEGMGLMVFE